MSYIVEYVLAQHLANLMYRLSTLSAILPIKHWPNYGFGTVSNCSALTTLDAFGCLGVKIGLCGDDSTTL